MDTLESLKAKAYDLLASIDYCQGQLRQINQKIAELSKPTGSVKVAEDNTA